MKKVGNLKDRHFIKFQTNSDTKPGVSIQDGFHIFGQVLNALVSALPILQCGASLVDPSYEVKGFKYFFKVLGRFSPIGVNFTRLVSGITEQARKLLART